jgi:hypothetical protein
VTRHSAMRDNRGRRWEESTPYYLSHFAFASCALLFKVCAQPGCKRAPGLVQAGCPFTDFCIKHASPRLYRWSGLIIYWSL